MTDSRLLAMQRIFGAIIALSSLITVPPMLIAQVLGEPSRLASIADRMLASSSLVSAM